MDQVTVWTVGGVASIDGHTNYDHLTLQFPLILQSTFRWCSPWLDTFSQLSLLSSAGSCFSGKRNPLHANCTGSNGKPTHLATSWWTETTCTRKNEQLAHFGLLLAFAVYIDLWETWTEWICNRTLHLQQTCCWTTGNASCSLYQRRLQEFIIAVVTVAWIRLSIFWAAHTVMKSQHMWHIPQILMRRDHITDIHKDGRGIGTKSSQKTQDVHASILHRWHHLKSAQ